MLQTIREKTQGLFAMVVFGLLSVTFALWGVQYYIKARSTDHIVAQVDGSEITHTQWQHAYQRLSHIWQVENGKGMHLSEADQQRLQKQALDELVMMNVLSKAVAENGYYIAPEIVNVAIKNLPLFQEKGQFSEQRFAQLLNYLAYSEESFSDEMEKRILTSQFRQGVLASAFILPEELQKHLRLSHQSRDIRYAIIAADKLVAHKPVSDQEVQAYYTAHKKDFVSAESVSLQYLQLSQENIASGLNPTDAVLKQFYQDNADLITSPGQTTMPTFEKVRAKVKQAWMQQQLQQRLSDAMELLSELTYTHPDTLQIAAEKLGLTIKKTESFTREGGKTALTQAPKVIQAAFSQDVIEQANNSAPIELPDGSAIVLRVDEHTPESVLPLPKVRPRIEAAIQRNRAIAQAATLGQSVIAALKSGQSLPMVHPPIVWQTRMGIHRTKNNIADLPTPVIEQSFSLPKPILKKPAVTGFALPSGDYVVLELTAVHRDKVESTQAQLAQLKQQLKYGLGLWEYDLSVKHFMRATKVVIKQDPTAHDDQI